jgi:hypothetical protein
MNTPARLRLVGTLCASLSLLIPLLACGDLEELEDIDEPVVDIPEVEPVGETAEPAAEPSGGGVCARAQECCNAYHEAMGTAAQGGSACAAYANVPPSGEFGCQSAIDGFRSGLTALSREVPAACQ